jgi:hypothetical protein
MEEHLRKLEGMYSRELIQLIRWSLQIDPLERPQSVFALQKALREHMMPEKKEETLLEKISGKVRNLFGGSGKDAQQTSTSTTSATTIHTDNTR